MSDMPTPDTFRACCQLGVPCLVSQSEADRMSDDYAKEFEQAVQSLVQTSQEFFSQPHEP